MELKTNKALSLFRSGCYKEAFAIFATFRIGYRPEERRTLQIAHESLCGNAKFYKQIGVDTDSEIKKAKELITSKYIKL